MKAFLEPERLFRFLLWCVAFLFAWFLIGFGGLVIEDLPKTETTITLKDFETPAMKQIRTEEEANRKLLVEQMDHRQVLAQSLQKAISIYNAEHSNFENWLSTRTATESTAQNPALIMRSKQLEQLKTAEQSIQNKIQTIDSKAVLLNQSLSQQNEAYNKLQVNSIKLYEKALFVQELYVFMIRLLFILPLLFVAVWLFVRQRKSKYWPFVWGFIFFALFSFFIELVPYLPSYGGYVHYLVGLILVYFSGFYGIRWMQQYLARRKLEEEASETSRRQKLDPSLAIKKITAELCPSCSRHTPISEELLMNYCMHCGLTLFKNCPNCAVRHNAFYTFCPSCGVSARETDSEH
jgi:predicted RNA-binding Zn-ribbon protein involved in translation (DUF1610 family)